FQTVRLLNTIDGGGVAFRSRELYEKAVKVRDYGIDRSSFRDTLGEINPACDITLPGYGAMLNEINSYIGTVQMTQIDELISVQRENAKCWIERLHLEDRTVKAMWRQKNTSPNYWVFGVLAQTKQETIKAFRKSGYYASSVHSNNSLYSLFGTQLELVGVKEFSEKFLALPCGWWFGSQ
ncbi:MAG: DegT/DnrJ/EryC1/StrS family aminotransferase, partial [Bacteroidetes bacterium]|nr:DegT/DnrJ/EryC1/StrS family aminotransferase [Bacteroidota bacterium]